MGEIDFLIGRTVERVEDDGRIVFAAGAGPEPQIYADTFGSVCANAGGAPLPPSSLVGRRW